MNSPTWLDLNSPSIVPPLGSRRAPNLDPVGLMISCGPDFRLAASFNKSSDKTHFFNSTLITCKDGDKGTAIVGPFIGAPYAVMLMESMIVQGVKKVIVLGWCGAVTKDLQVGDLIIPTRSIVDEGTSRNYVQLNGDDPYVEPDESLCKLLADQAEKKDTSVQQVPIWTTDGVYRETQKKVSHFADHGALAVEMECSALFSVGQFRTIPVAALLVVSDSVASKDWDPGFRNKKFKTARKKAVEIVLSMTQVLTDHG